MIKKIEIDIKTSQEKRVREVSFKCRVFDQFSFR